MSILYLKEKRKILQNFYELMHSKKLKLFKEKTLVEIARKLNALL